METSLPILVSIITLLVAIWAPIANDKNALGAKRILAWFAVIMVTLVIPSVLIILVVIQLSARLLAPTSNDVSAFVSQIAWAAGASGSVFPFIWGIKFYHRLENWISGLISPPEGGKKKRATREKTGGTEK